MFAYSNVDLLSVGIAVAASLILGFSIFYSDSKSATSRLFLAFTFVNAGWSIFNYLNYQVSDPIIVLWFIRLVMFFAVLQAATFFLLVKVFPGPSYSFPKWYKTFLFPFVIAVAILTLTPWVFSGVENVSIGSVSQPVAAWGIVPFGLLSISLVLLGITTLISKTIKSSGKERLPYLELLAGIILMFSLIIFFNFFATTIWNTTRFIPLSAVFTLPFVVLAAYAIYKHRLLNVKIITTEILTFTLAMVALFEVVISREVLIIIFRSGIFVLILAFGILLIKSVRKEVEQREQLEELTKQLQVANKKLEELSAYKTQLLSLASHQTKSPLSAIKSYASLLVQGLFGPVNDQIKDKLNKIMLAADELLSLIDTFLNLRKVEEGRMDYTMQRVDLVELVRQKAEELQPLTQNKNLGYEVHLPEHPIMINADSQKLQQVLQNFIDNAIKYTPQGKVEINLREEGGYTIFSVKDSGYGIPASLIPHLFEEYVRDDRIKNQIRGTGFGLFIARKIAEAHGGTIWAESEGENKGSTFYLKIRKADSS
ncbi:MAG: hypothetical protein KGZ30_00650 [Anaplasmataceae bacterium]|nr:hypothetical protein [Anaplasmataceae bacterium]